MKTASNAWARYALALLTVVAAAAITQAVPILRDRFTWFLFWPLILGLSWVAGSGPALLATALSTLLVTFQFKREAVDLGQQPELLMAAGLFALIGASAATLARWRAAAESSLHESHARLTQLAAEERRAREAAEASNRAKDAFLATVSHELRAPLSPILTWVRMLRGNQLPPEQVSRALEVIERNARMQAQLIEDLLDVARIVEGKLRLQVRPVALVDVIKNAVESVRPAADARELRLQLVLDSTVAPIAGDPARLQQLVWNLLSNAIKFTPKGGRVHVVLERVNSHIEIAVSDSGQGILPEQLPHLFERFWQADSSTSRTFSGLGLGLGIVRHIAELHGGSVAAESPGPGQGSTFTVKLPIAPMVRTAGEGQRRHPSLHDSLAAPSRLDNLRLLLVDDEPDASEALRMMLEESGAEMRVAGSVAHAMDILQRWQPDLIISDIGMPGEDGYALMAKVKAAPAEIANIPVLALTAYASSEDRARLLAAGFRLHVAKPADPGELTAAIRSLVS